MTGAPEPKEKAALVEAYKKLLRDVLHQRPSGARLRLAAALGKTRGFVSHMCNPAYPAPIPAPHLEAIFEICHFSPAEKRAFLDLYDRAHPGRHGRSRETPSLRSLKLEVYDFGDARRNREFDALIKDASRRLARLVAHRD